MVARYRAPQQISVQQMRRLCAAGQADRMIGLEEMHVTAVERDAGGPRGKR